MPWRIQQKGPSGCRGGNDTAVWRGLYRKCTEPGNLSICSDGVFVYLLLLIINIKLRSIQHVLVSQNQHMLYNKMRYERDKERSRNKDLHCDGPPFGRDSATK